MVQVTSAEMLRNQIKRHQAVVSVYLILKKDEQYLLSLRGNTGYADGMYGLVAGHVEKNESATAALIREVKEEINIHLQETDLKFEHVMHLKTNRSDIALFFSCKHYTGTIQNMEPDKCQRVAFFPKDALPSNTIDYIRHALEAIESSVVYSEKGWEE